MSIDVDVENFVGTIVLNRPDKRNALNASMRTELFDAFRRLEEDPDCRCMVLAAEGKSFCTGADLKEMSQLRLRVPPPDYAPQLGRNIIVSKPVIGAVQGHALAGGFLLAQNCDLLLAAEDAEFGISEVRRGRGAPWAAPLITKVGERAMMEMLVTGRHIGARRAYEIGFVNAVVPGERLRDEAADWGRTIAANAPLSVKAAREMVHFCADMGRSAALEVAEAIYRSVYESEDAQEGPRAFAEGREPVWQNR